MATRKSEEIVRLSCPEIEPAWTLLDRGNFGAAKNTVKAAIAACPEDRAADVNAAAQQLLFCMEPDPWARRLAAVAFVVLLVLVINYVG